MGGGTCGRGSCLVVFAMRLFLVTVPRGRESVVQEVVRELGNYVHNVFITRSADECDVMCTFRTHNGHTISVIQRLQEQGVGLHFGYLDVVPIETVIPIVNKPARSKLRGILRTRERLPIEAILETVTSSSSLCFDLLAYLICASVISALGLASNSTVTVVASMLVSPMMGPISLFCVALLLRSPSLVALAVRNLTIFVLIATAIGFVLALVFLPFLDTFDWPTNEMTSRGSINTLAVNAGVASASGVVVALTTSTQGVGPLIGVAISASLLPPIVNTGMLLSLLAFGPLVNDRIEPYTIFSYAGISFLLFVINVLCIAVFALGTLYLKRVHKGRTWRFGDRIDAYNSLRWFKPTPTPTNNDDLDERPNPPIMASLQL